jgi:hypothetical protein
MPRLATATFPTGGRRASLEATDLVTIQGYFDEN